MSSSARQMLSPAQLFTFSTWIVVSALIESLYAWAHAVMHCAAPVAATDSALTPSTLSTMGRHWARTSASITAALVARTARALWCEGRVSLLMMLSRSRSKPHARHVIGAWLRNSSARCPACRRRSALRRSEGVRPTCADAETLEMQQRGTNTKPGGGIEPPTGVPLLGIIFDLHSRESREGALDRSKRPVEHVASRVEYAETIAQTGPGLHVKK